MVRPRYPQGFESPHSFVTGQNVFNSDDQRMARMEVAIGVRWRHDNGKRLTVPFGEIVRIKKAAFFPKFVYP